MNEAPIFIHSLFRAGSTYLFKVFRRSECGYWCYQEPLHELAVVYRENPSGLQEDHGEAKAQLLRHPQVEGSYFRELLETWPAWKNVINEQIIYDVYFAGQAEDIGVAYWRALAEAARGRPVFQECRTAGRIGAIKGQMNGSHIYLWRNPWDQWWSYKVTPYFDVANQLIIHARHAPQPVQHLLATLDLPAYGRDDLAGAFAFYGARPLGSEHSYLVFYLLWCLALREGNRHADLVLNIDRLSDSADYQTEMQARLNGAGIAGIDFSDCRVPQGRYLEKDQAFFSELEGRVHQCLKDGGWSQQDIDHIQAMRQQNQPVSWNAPIESISPADMAEQASRARMLACRFETSSASAEAKAQQAESRATEAESRATEAESRATEAESRAAEAESRAAEAESRAAEAEPRAQEQESRALAAEAHHAAQAQHIDELGGNSHYWWQQACALETERDALRQSWSWRITAPVRCVGGVAIHAIPRLRHATNHPAHLSINVLQRPLAMMMRVVLRHPGLSYRLNQHLLRYPTLHQQLLGVARGQGVMPGVSTYVSPYPPSTMAETEVPGHLTPHARQIFHGLKAAIESRQKENG